MTQSFDDHLTNLLVHQMCFCLRYQSAAVLGDSTAGASLIDASATLKNLVEAIESLKESGLCAIDLLLVDLFLHRLELIGSNG
jgi:hypothetical protein